MNIYQDYRPHKFSDVVGHEKIVKELLKRSVDKNFGSTLFFVGGSGNGKCLSYDEEITVYVSDEVANKIDFLGFSN